VRTIRIGSGAGYSGDRIEPAVELAEKGDIQYLVFECLGERTVALAQQARMKNPEGGYDPLLEERMRAVLPLCAAKGIKIVTNMGAVNPGSGSATRSKRSIPTARPPAAARGSRRGMWSRWHQCCFRASWRSRKSVLWGRKVKLREIAHSRTGDKGNTSNISVIAYDAKHYPLLLAQVTSERVKAHFAGVVEGEVVRYELPNLAALNFVMTQALGGGVTRSLALDAHGKSLSSALLDLDIEPGSDDK
jgi:hypothetical protein